MTKTQMKKQGRHVPVTARDSYIISLALALALETIDRIPNEADRPFSDQQDMKRLLEDGMDDRDLAIFISLAKSIWEKLD
jgi:hypothetical protein